MYALMRDKNKIKDELYHCDFFEWYEDELELKIKIENAPFNIPKVSFPEYFYGKYMSVYEC
jgi:hypothetical protein